MNQKALAKLRLDSAIAMLARSMFISGRKHRWFRLAYDRLRQRCHVAGTPHDTGGRLNALRRKCRD